MTPFQLLLPLPLSASRPDVTSRVGEPAPPAESATRLAVVANSTVYVPLVVKFALSAVPGSPVSHCAGSDQAPVFPSQLRCVIGRPLHNGEGNATGTRGPGSTVFWH